MYSSVIDVGRPQSHPHCTCQPRAQPSTFSADVLYATFVQSSVPLTNPSHLPRTQGEAHPGSQRSYPSHSRHHPVAGMPAFSLFIDDTVAEASPVLARMRLDGLDRAALPFAERHVQAWRGAPEPDMDAEMLVSVIRVRSSY